MGRDSSPARVLQDPLFSVGLPEHFQSRAGRRQVPHPSIERHKSGFVPPGQRQQISVRNLLVPQQPRQRSAEVPRNRRWQSFQIDVPGILDHQAQQRRRLGRTPWARDNRGIRGQPNEPKLGEGAGGSTVPARFQPLDYRPMELVVGPRHGQQDVYIQKQQFRSSLLHR